MSLPKLPGARIMHQDLETGDAIGKPYAKFTLEGDEWVQTKDIVRFNGPVMTEGTVRGLPASEAVPLVNVTYGYSVSQHGMTVNFAQSNSSEHAVPARSFGLLDEDSQVIVCDIGLRIPRKL